MSTANQFLLWAIDVREPRNTILLYKFRWKVGSFRAGRQESLNRRQTTAVTINGKCIAAFAGGTTILTGKFYDIAANVEAAAARSVDWAVVLKRWK